MQLETTNPHCFIYKTEELLVELLGGVRIDGLDRMRVTIKVTVVNRKHTEYLTNPELAGLSVRHNLDLYNDTQVEKFVRRVAEKLETGSIAITKAIADITCSCPESSTSTVPAHVCPCAGKWVGRRHWALMNGGCKYLILQTDKHCGIDFSATSGNT